MLRYVPLRRVRLLRRLAIVRHHVYTGPPLKVRRLVRQRADDTCEWPVCGRIGTDYHHRLNRKAGGRHGARKHEMNQPAWIVLACRFHHDRVTSASGDQLTEAKDYGWVMGEHETAPEVPIQTCHGLVLLDDCGGWTGYPT